MSRGARVRRNRNAVQAAFRNCAAPRANLQRTPTQPGPGRYGYVLGAVGAPERPESAVRISKASVAPQHNGHRELHAAVIDGALRGVAPSVAHSDR